MIIFFNKIIKNSLRRITAIFPPAGIPSAQRFKNNFSTRMSSHRGQVAVLMILLIAIGLIFYAVVLNLGRMSQVKTQTLIAANTTATQLASFMASYGQKLFEESLGGRRKVCGFTALFSALLMVIIIIIIIIIIIVSWGAATAAALAVGITMTATTAAIVGVMIGLALAMAIASLALQATVVEPGITEMWNRMMGDTMNETDQFVERGIQSALGSMVTDQVRIPDFLDGDTDTLYGYDGPRNLQTPLFPLDPARGANDYISRFGFLYTQQRLKGLPALKQSDAIEEFVEALRELIGDKNDGWGLSDQFDCASVPGIKPAECDPCCQPPGMPNPLCEDTGVLPDDRPSCCSNSVNYDPAETDCVTVSLRPAGCGDPTANCLATTPYGVGGPGYPWVYDPYYENPTNSFLSLREQIGRDDEHHLYRVEQSTSFQTPSLRREVLSNSPSDPPRSPGFNLSDASGLYSADPITRSVRQVVLRRYFFPKRFLQKRTEHA